MIIDESLGAKGSERRAELYTEYCMQTKKLTERTVTDDIYVHGEWRKHERVETVDDQITDMMAFRAQSENVLWIDVRLGDEIIGFEIRNIKTGEIERYLMPKYRNSSSLRIKRLKRSRTSFYYEMVYEPSLS